MFLVYCLCRSVVGQKSSIMQNCVASNQTVRGQKLDLTTLLDWREMCGAVWIANWRLMDQIKLCTFVNCPWRYLFYFIFFFRFGCSSTGNAKTVFFENGSQSERFENAETAFFTSLLCGQEKRQRRENDDVIALHMNGERVIELLAKSFRTLKQHNFVV